MKHMPFLSFNNYQKEKTKFLISVLKFYIAKRKKTKHKNSIATTMLRLRNNHWI